MKCPNCQSPMFVTDETTSARSQVTFYRCSLCVSEHVSSQPVVESISYDLINSIGSLATERKRYVMV